MVKLRLLTAPWRLICIGLQEHIQNNGQDGFLGFWFNTTYHGSTKIAPFKALYGQDPPSLLRFTEEISAVEEVNQQLAACNIILDELKANLTHAQAQMKMYADAKHCEVLFQPGDLVYL